MSVITSLTQWANHPIKTNITKIGKVKNRLFALLPLIVSVHNTSDLLKTNLVVPGGERFSRNTAELHSGPGF